MTTRTESPGDGDDKCIDHLPAEQCEPMSPENQPPPVEPLCLPPNMAPEPGTCLAPATNGLPSGLMIDCSIPENNDGQVIYWTVPGREETIGMSSCGDMGAESNAWVDGGPFPVLIAGGLLMLIALLALIGRLAR